MLHHLERTFRRWLACLTDFGADCVALMTDSLSPMAKLMSLSLQPLLSSVADAVEAILLTMHDEDFSGYTKATVKSLYQYIYRLID